MLIMGGGCPPTWRQPEQSPGGTFLQFRHQMSDVALGAGRQPVNLLMRAVHVRTKQMNIKWMTNFENSNVNIRMCYKIIII